MLEEYKKKNRKPRPRDYIFKSFTQKAAIDVTDRELQDY